MKKSCNGCRALIGDSVEPFKCGLGYKTKGEILMDIEVCLIPLEQCPKPKTYKEYCLLQKQLEGGLKSK